MTHSPFLVSTGWLRTFTRRPQPSVRLVCFPYAGGSANLFRPWATSLPDWVEVIGVQYPGRQDRHHEAPILDMHLLADAVAGAVQPLLNRPMVFFGHSVGATVAFEVARRLRPRFPSPLQRLFVSARKAPADLRSNGIDYRSDDAMRRYMRQLGGAAGRTVDDKELWEVAMPALRSDLIMAEAYRYDPNARIAAPITALAASEERACGLEEMERWSSCTIGGFEASEMPGGHFYVEDNPPELTDILTRRLAPTL